MDELDDELFGKSKTKISTVSMLYILLLILQ